jgi:ribulose-phosphate 3-epimerase
MVERPDLRWEAFRGAGAESIVFHGECAVDGHALAQKIHGAGLLVGVAINPRTPLESCMPLLDAVDWVIFMGVEPGFCGQKFQDSVLEKISLAHRRRREQKFSFAIGVDGGVCAENIPRLLDAGTDIFIAGSGIFHSPNPSVAYDHLSNLLRRNGTKDAPPRLD